MWIYQSFRSISAALHLWMTLSLTARAWYYVISWRKSSTGAVFMAQRQFSFVMSYVLDKRPVTQRQMISGDWIMNRKAEFAWSSTMDFSTGSLSKPITRVTWIKDGSGLLRIHHIWICEWENDDYAWVCESSSFHTPQLIRSFENHESRKLTSKKLKNNKC